MRTPDRVPSPRRGCTVRRRPEGFVRSDDRPSLHEFQQVVGELPLHGKQSRRAEADVPGRLRIRVDEAPEEILGGDPPVLDIGDHVALVEFGGRTRGQVATDGLRIAPHGRHRGHLEGRQVAHQGAPPSSMEAEHRHQVVGRQGGGRHVVDVGAGRRIESELPHGRGEELSVGPPGFPVAVLVGLQPHARRLGPAPEPRDHPRVRIGLLALVDGPVDHELPELLE